MFKPIKWQHLRYEGRVTKIVSIFVLENSRITPISKL